MILAPNHPSDDEIVEQLVAHNAQAILKYGRAVSCVFPTEDQPDSPCFSYTVGNSIESSDTSLVYPEIIVTMNGISPRDLGLICNVVSDEMEKILSECPGFDEWDNLTISWLNANDKEALVRLRAVHESVKRTHTTQVGMLRAALTDLGRDDYPLYQVILSTPEHVFIDQPYPEEDPEGTVNPEYSRKFHSLGVLLPGPDDAPLVNRNLH